MKLNYSIFIKNTCQNVKIETDVIRFFTLFLNHLSQNNLENLPHTTINFLIDNQILSHFHNSTTCHNNFFHIVSNVITFIITQYNPKKIYFYHIPLYMSNPPENIKIFIDLQKNMLNMFDFSFFEQNYKIIGNYFEIKKYFNDLLSSIHPKYYIKDKDIEVFYAFMSNVIQNIGNYLENGSIKNYCLEHFKDKVLRDRIFDILDNDYKIDFDMTEMEIIDERYRKKVRNIVNFLVRYLLVIGMQESYHSSHKRIKVFNIFARFIKYDIGENIIPFMKNNIC